MFSHVFDGTMPFPAPSPMSGQALPSSLFPPRMAHLILSAMLAACPVTVFWICVLRA